MFRRCAISVFSILIVLGLSIGCASAPAPQPTATAMPTEMPADTPGPATATPEPEPEPTATPAPTATPGPPPPIMLSLEMVADGLNSPVAVVPVDDGSGRLFVVDRVGLVYVVTSEGDMLSQPFLDVRDRMVELRERFDERGLLGLAFHPDFEENGRFFVYYSAPLREEASSGWDHTAHISEFSVAMDNPDAADPNSERVLLMVDEPQFNHDGGQVVFGPDGYLYISFGDGGGANDTGTGHGLDGNGQDPTTLLGSILRIDVDSGDPYGIPPDNPFAGDDSGADEVFAYGLRNPWRISFDAGGEHQLYVADVGQNLWEEVDIVTNGGNYGWNIREGTHCFDHHNPDMSAEECPDIGLMDEPLIGPIIEYGHADQPGGLGISVTGGFFYRGDDVAELENMYVFGDWSTSFAMPDGRLMAAAPSGSEGELWTIQMVRIMNTEDGLPHAFVLGFGQDLDNELYVLTNESTGPTGTTGVVWKIVPAM